MEVISAIKTRRSIRRYKSTAVDTKTLELVLEAARWAPSWANSQCWRFIIVRNRHIRAELAQLLAGNRAAQAIREAPAIIVACAELGKSGYLKGQLTTDKGDWYLFDVALAMQNLALAAHSLGLGTVHIGHFDARRVAALLEVPAGFCVVEMTPLGYPDEEPEARPRKELAAIVFNDKYGISYRHEL